MKSWVHLDPDNIQISNWVQPDNFQITNCVQLDPDNI